MKMFKSFCSLMLVVLMLLTSVSFTAFADETATDGTETTFQGATKWLYPSSDGTVLSSSDLKSYTKDTSNGFNAIYYKNGSTNSSNAYLVVKNSTIATPAEAEIANITGYHFIRQALGSSYSKKTGISYEPLLADKNNPYYEVWVELAGHTNSVDVPLTIEIVGDDGTFTGTLPEATEPTDGSQGWTRNMYKVGNIKLSDAQFNKVNIWLPLDREYLDKNKKTENGEEDARSDYMSIGGVKLVQLEGTPKELLELERSINVLEPKKGRTAAWGHFANTSTNTYYNSLGTIDDPYNLGLTDAFTERSYDAGFNTYTAQRKAYIYKGLWANSEQQAGWYKMYIDKVAHNGKTPVPYLGISVLHRDGNTNFIMDRNLDKDGGTWQSSRHYIGTFYMSHGGNNQIRLYSPSIVDGGSTEMRYDLGAIICIPVTEEEAANAKAEELTYEKDLYLKPLYTANFDEGYTVADGSELEWYGGQYQLKMDATEGETSVTASYTENCGDIENLLDFNEGVIDFDLYYTYSQGVLTKTEEGALAEGTVYKAPYFSVILGKAADKIAEFRIHNNKVQLIETNADKVTTSDLYVPFDYYYNLTTEKLVGSTLAGIGWKSNTRIEIIDVTNENIEKGIEATSRLKSTAGKNGATKLLKIYINGGSTSEICLGAMYIPEGSILYEDDDSIADNYIKFVNNPGVGTTEQTNLIKIKNLSVAVPDNTITSGDVVEEITDLAVADGTASWASKTWIPFKHTNKLGVRYNNANYSKMIAAYSNGAMKAVDACNVSVIAGDKKTVNVSVDVETGDTVKLFSFEDYKTLKPLNAAETVNAQ